MINFKKLLAGTLSAAMVLGTTFVPAFADEKIMTFGDFIQAVKDANGTYDGNGVTVKWSAETGCFDTREEHSCTVANKTATANTPNRVNSNLAQYHEFDSNDDLNISISNVNFVYEKSDFTICANSEWKGKFTTDQAPSAQLYLMNNGNVTVTNCTFDNVVLTMRSDNVDDVENRTVTVDGCEFKNIENSYGIKDLQAGNVTVKNSKFINTKSGIMFSGYNGKDTPVKSITVENNTFDLTNTAKSHLFQIQENCKFTDDSKLRIKDNTSTNDAFVFRLRSTSFDIEKNLDYSNAGITTTKLSYCESEKEIPLIFDENGNITKQLWEDLSKNVKVGEDEYATLVEALTAVYKNGPYPAPVTIDCKAGADVGKMTHGHVADDIIINGNGARVSYNGETKSCEGDLEFDTWKYSRSTGEQANDGKYLEKDVNVVVNDLDGIGAWGQRNTMHTINIKFNNCKKMTKVLFRSGQNDSVGDINVELNNCSFDKTLNANATPDTSVHITSPANVKIKNCTFKSIAAPVNLSNKSSKNQKITIDGCAFVDCATQDTVEGEDWGDYAAPIRFVTTSTGKIEANVKGTSISYTDVKTNVGNGDIVLGDGRAGKDSNPNVTLNISGTAAEIQTQYPDKDTVTTNVEETETRTLKMTSAPTKVKAVFEESTDKVENGKAYDLYIEADGEIINRLTSAHFTFELVTTNAAIEYAVKGADKVSVTGDVNNANRYLFNFDGKDVASATDRRIKLGQIVFTGVGEFTFAIIGDDNVVNATEASDNIVYFYESTGLDTSNKIDGEIAQETANLTVNVSFPNAINDNAIGYQDMRVTVSGNGITEEAKLGKGGIELNNGAYSVEFNGKLVKNNTYTVTVSGAGYRTARYTVNMTGDKTLNFWNNVMDDAKAIEVGGTTTKKNFLAGDIVKDGKINIYDLSAVVSYFGASGLSVDNNPGYAKYDLNRDGKIDSKDVAYVLVSWGE